MRRLDLLKFTLACTLCCALAGSALYAKKKTKPESAAAVSPVTAQMTEDQKALHALNRLTFGARPGDLDEIHRIGLQAWIDRQLHPADVTENPLLEARLQPLDTLRMDSKDLVKRYPNQQTIKAIIDGRQPFPQDPQQRILVQKMIAKYRQKLQADNNGTAAPDPDPKMTLSSLRIDDQQRQILQHGKPAEQVALLESMPQDEQWDALDALPNGARQRLLPRSRRTFAERFRCSTDPRR